MRKPASLLADLIARSGGIVLTNAVGQRWLGYDELSKAYPGLIHLLIQGNHDGSAAVDYTVNATMGFPHVTGPDSLREPVNHVLPAWDIACGLYAAIGLIAAERRRRLTGEGSQLTLALADVALAVTAHLGFLAEAQLTGADRQRIGNYLYGGFARDFTTSDGERVMVVALTGRHFADLAAVTGLTATFAELERLLGADFSTDGDRYTHREVLASLLRPWFAGRELAQVARELDGTSVLWSRYRRFTEMAAEEAKAGNPLLREITQPGVGPLLAPRSPLYVAGAEQVRPAPVLGADTARLLGDFLGLSAEQIGALMERGVVGGPGTGQLSPRRPPTPAAPRPPAAPAQSGPHPQRSHPKSLIII